MLIITAIASSMVLCGAGVTAIAPNASKSASKTATRAVVIASTAASACRAGSTCGAGCEILCSTADPCRLDNDCFSGSCTDERCDEATSSIELADALDGRMKLAFAVQNNVTTTPPNWVGSFDAAPLFKEWNIVKATYGYPSDMAIVNDPLGGTPTSPHVLQILYPKGSYNPMGKTIGGIGISANPIDISRSVNVTIEYEVFFPNGFVFNKGGKLPGLYGGHRSCTGGNPALDCFSTRFMWRAAGIGEVYLYVHQPAQARQLCHPPFLIPQTYCNPEYGISIDRGGFVFKTGAWNKIRQDVSINSFANGTRPNPDGRITVWKDDKLVFSLPGLVFRLKPTVNFLGLDIETFFGGATSDYATPIDQYSYFRNFKLWAS